MDQLVSTFRFRIGGQLGPVTVHIWQDIDDGHLSAEYDHHLRTPLQAGISAPQPSSHHDTPEEAIRSIATTLDSEFREAVNAGHSPNESWLVRNDRS